LAKSKVTVVIQNGSRIGYKIGYKIGYTNSYKNSSSSIWPDNR